MAAESTDAVAADAKMGPLVIHALLKGRLDPSIVAISNALGKSARRRIGPSCAAPAPFMVHIVCVQRGKCRPRTAQ